MDEHLKNVSENKGNPILVSMKKAYARFVKIRGNPHEIALGFALGLFIGMAPCMGIQTIIAVFFASRFWLLPEWDWICRIPGLFSRW